jgi:hypothetical protein
VLQKAGWAPVVQDLPGGPCPLVVVVLAVQASRHSNRPVCPGSSAAVLPFYGIGPRARYFLGLDIYSNEAIPASGGPA